MSVTDQQETFFQKELLPELRNLEIIRVKQLLRLAYILFALLASFAGAMLLFNPFFILVLLLVFLGLYGVLFGRGRERFDFPSAYRNVMNKKMAGLLMEASAYQSNRYIGEKELLQSGIIPGPVDDYSGEGLLEGNVGSTPVVMSQLHTRNMERHPNGDITYTTIFRGLLLRAEIGADNQDILYIVSDNDEHLAAYFEEKRRDINILQPEIVTTGNEKFDASFTVYATDNTLLQQFLTKEVQTVLTDLVATYGPGIRCSLVQQYLFIAYPWREKMFVPSIYKSALDLTGFKEYAAVLKVAENLIQAAAGAVKS
jgi:hypothetical protein